MNEELVNSIRHFYTTKRWEFHDIPTHILFVSPSKKIYEAYDKSSGVMLGGSYEFIMKSKFKELRQKVHDIYSEFAEFKE